MTAGAVVVGWRVCAALAVASAALHGIMVARATSVAVVGVTVAMLAVCLHCARELWIGPTARTWVLLALMNLAMIAVHLPGSAQHHHAGGAATLTPLSEQHSTLMMVATALAAVEVTVAAAVLYHGTRSPSHRLHVSPPNGRSGLGDMRADGGVDRDRNCTPNQLRHRVISGTS